MSSETIDLRVTVDATQADAALRATRASAESAATAGGKLAVSLEDLDKRGSKAATAVGSLNGLLGRTGQVGQETAGAIADVSMLLAEGGPLGLGIAAATLAIGALADAWVTSKKAAEDAAKAQIKAVVDVAGAVQASRDASVASLRGALGQSASEQTLADLQAQLVEAQRQRAEAADLTVIYELGGTLLQAKQRSDEMVALVDSQIEKLNLQIAQITPLIEEERTAREALAAAERLRGSTSGGPGGGQRVPSAESPPTGRVFGVAGDAATIAAVRAQRAQQEMTTRLDEERIAHAQRTQERMQATEAAGAAFAIEQEQRKHDAILALDEQRTVEAKRLADERMQAEMQAAQVVAGYATQAAGIVASAATTMTAELIAGQERAVEHFALTIMQQAGQALVSYGVQLEGAAVVSALTGNPAAIAQAAGGAALIGAGVGLGGVAGGLSMVSDRNAAAARDRGVNTGASQSRGTGDGLTVQISYGVSGPQPEDTARAVAVAVRNARKREMA